VCQADRVIIGVGIDVVDIARFEASLHRTTNLRDRLFTPTERVRQPSSLAARFAAKEALAKALGAPAGMRWQDAEIVSEDSGRPRFDLRGTVLARAEELGVRGVHVSLSHDAGIASAVVVLEG
jgi:holo-[acyl-carrier protein] synthase